MKNFSYKSEQTRGTTYWYNNFMPFLYHEKLPSFTHAAKWKRSNVVSSISGFLCENYVRPQEMFPFKYRAPYNFNMQL
jgi:hypothetical protein